MARPFSVFTAAIGERAAAALATKSESKQTARTHRNGVSDEAIMTNLPWLGHKSSNPLNQPERDGAHESSSAANRKPWRPDAAFRTSTSVAPALRSVLDPHWTLEVRFETMRQEQFAHEAA